MAGIASKLMCLFLILGLAAPCLATEYVVGASTGWSVEANLQVWLNRKAFKVGDVLVFNYDPKLHNLAQVDITGYNTCLPTNILSIDNSGKSGRPLSLFPNQEFSTTFLLSSRIASTVSR